MYEKHTPRITETAKALWFTYLALTIVGVVALHVAGMTWFEACCHCFSAISLGAFSTHDRSVGYFKSTAIEMVLVVIMVVASLNFSRHFLSFRNLTLKPYKKDSEGKAVLIVLGASVLVVTMMLWLAGIYSGFSQALRHSLFNVVSI